MPDEPEVRPGAAYLDTMLAAIPWGALPVAIWDDAGAERWRGKGAQLIAEVLEALARYGLLVGEEHHHALTDRDARQWAGWILTLLPPDSMPGRKYASETGLGADGVLTHAGLEQCFPVAHRALAGEPREQARLHRGRRALLRWMEERDRRPST